MSIGLTVGICGGTFFTLFVLMNCVWKTKRKRTARPVNVPPVSQDAMLKALKAKEKKNQQSRSKSSFSVGTSNNDTIIDVNNSWMYAGGSSGGGDSSGGCDSGGGGLDSGGGGCDSGGGGFDSGGGGCDSGGGGFDSGGGGCDSGGGGSSWD